MQTNRWTNNEVYQGCGADSKFLMFCYTASILCVFFPLLISFRFDAFSFSIAFYSHSRSTEYISKPAFPDGKSARYMGGKCFKLFGTDFACYIYIEGMLLA